MCGQLWILDQHDWSAALGCLTGNRHIRKDIWLKDCLANDARIVAPVDTDATSAISINIDALQEYLNKIWVQNSRKKGRVPHREE
ncbi:MAG: hypothetical protein CTY31_13940 [Hyphomicrobium sp.]|nr:MAG: hypothetical protein CTY31_13940 [Hyphomicrobium sp.]